MTTVNLPSWVIEFLKATDDLSAVDNDSHVTEISASESIPIIRTFVHSPTGVAVARCLRGKGAQSLIDAIGQVGANQLWCRDTPWLGELNIQDRPLRCQS